MVILAVSSAAEHLLTRPGLQLVAACSRYLDHPLTHEGLERLAGLAGLPLQLLVHVVGDVPDLNRSHEN